jgi:hypothetical protein
MTTRLMTILTVIGLTAAALAQSPQPASRPSTRPSATTQATASTRPATRPIAEPVVSTFDPTASSRITLDLKQATAKQVYAEIAKQSGIVIRPLPKELFDNAELPRVDVKLDDAGLFAALREASERTGLSVQRVGPLREFIVQAGKTLIWGNYPSHQHGPFMVSVRYIQNQSSVDLTTNTATRVARIQLNVYAEPALRVVRSYNMAVLDEARDERGHKLTKYEDPVRAVERVNSASWSWPAQLPLATRRDGGSTIAILKGHAKAIVVTKAATAEIAFDPNMKDQKVLVGNASVTIKTVQRTGDNFVVTLAAEPDPALADVWSKIGLDSTFRLVDKDGRNLMRQQYGINTSKQVMLMFAKLDWNGGDPAGEPVKLIWEMPLELKEIKIPFEFRDIPLP